MEKVVYENGTVDTQGKPFSACLMVLSPHDVSNLIIGDTEEVKKYWESIEDSFDFEWYLFNTKDEMESGVKQITKEPAPSIDWMIFNVEDCEQGSAHK